MEALKNKVRIIGDIRGKGMMFGTEFVNPNEKPDMLGSYPASGEISAAVQKKCFEKGLIVEKRRKIRFCNALFGSFEYLRKGFEHCS